MTNRQDWHLCELSQQGIASRAYQPGPYSTDVLDHATSEIASGTKLGIDATRNLAGEEFKKPWPPLIRMDAKMRKKIDQMLPDR